MLLQAPLYGLIIILFIFSKADYLKITKLELDYNDTYMANVSYNLKAINWTTTVVNIKFYFIQEMKNLSLNFAAYRRYSDSHHYQPDLFNITFNACKVLRDGKHSSYYTNFLLRLFKQYSNVKRCPLIGEISLKNGNLNQGFFKALPIFEGMYLMKFRYFEVSRTNQSFVMELRLYGNVAKEVNRSQKKKN